MTYKIFLSKKGLILDFDGTIIDSLGDAAASFHYALAQVGSPLFTLPEIKKYFGMGADRIFKNLLKDDKKAAQSFEFYKEHQKQNVKNMPLHSGMTEVLKKFAENKIPLAIVTGRHGEDLAIVIERHGITSYFASVISDDHLSFSKPHPQGLQLALSQLKLKPQDALFVGDSVFDIQAGNAAGVTSVAALWDKHATKADFAGSSPDYWAEKPEDIWDIFQK